MTDAIADKLDELIRATAASPWLDSEAAARYLRISVRHFRERVAVQPDFPKVRNRPGVGLRWDRRELDEWLSRSE